MNNSSKLNYLSDFGFFSLTNFRSDLETFRMAKIKEDGELEILETVDNYLVPMDQMGQQRKTRPVRANVISLPKSTLEGKSEKRTLIGDPVTLALDLLKKLGIKIDLGIGISYEEISRVEFCFENIQCQAIAVTHNESVGSLMTIFGSDVNIGDIWYIDSLSSYLTKSRINYNSKVVGKDKIDKFVEEITVDNTYEAKSEKDDDDSRSKKTQKSDPNYYIISTVLKSNKFRVSFYDSRQTNVGVKLNIAQGVSLEAGYQVSNEKQNTLEYISDEKFLAFGVQLIPFHLELRGPRSTAKPFLKYEYNQFGLRKWTGEIFNEELNSKLRQSIEQNTET